MGGKQLFEDPKTPAKGKEPVNDQEDEKDDQEYDVVIDVKQFLRNLKDRTIELHSKDKDCMNAGRTAEMALDLLKKKYATWVEDWMPILVAYTFNKGMPSMKLIQSDRVRAVEIYGEKFIKAIETIRNADVDSEWGLNQGETMLTLFKPIVYAALNSIVASADYSNTTGLFSHRNSMMARLVKYTALDISIANIKDTKVHALSREIDCERSVDYKVMKGLNLLRKYGSEIKDRGENRKELINAAMKKELDGEKEGKKDSK